MNDTIRPIILCGGPGSRLWPLSRAHEPKPLLPLGANGSPLLRDTLLRVSAISAQAPTIVCREAHRFLVRELCDDDDADATYLIEPDGRDTAAAVALATYADADPNDLLFFTPADLQLDDATALHRAIASATAAAEHGNIVIFGSPADQPRGDLGWIVPAQLVREQPERVLRFVEKPDFSVANALLADGRALWNAGMVLATRRALRAALEAYAPEIVAAVRSSLASATALDGRTRRVSDAILSCPRLAFDRAVLEHASNVVVTPLLTRWRDLGTWASVHDATPHDPAGNSLIGDVIAHDTEGCLLYATGRLVATVGVRDIAVVETADAVLVSSLNTTQEVRTVVSALQAREERDRHPVARRPWGSYRVLAQGDGWRCKHLAIAPGESLSLQAHAHRDEHWIVVGGTGTLELDGDRRAIGVGDTLFVGRGQWHRLTASDGVPIEIIEVQRGEQLAEDDIARRDDRYGR